MDTFAPVNGLGLEGLSSITHAYGLGGTQSGCAVSILFDAGARPRAAAVRALASSSAGFAISLDPEIDGEGEGGWLELFAHGLTFDCLGLVPGVGEPLPEQRFHFGFAQAIECGQMEAVTLVPGPHLAGGVGMFPVVRGLAWLGALLADLPGARAVCWHAAGSCNAPDHYRTSVLRWIEGGAFPGLGLTALAPTPENGIASVGLALFIGQEVVLAPELAADRGDGAKLALRLVHWLVENGRVDAPSQLAGPAGETLLLEPQPNQQIIKVSKSL
jgi:hypothetical protein